MSTPIDVQRVHRSQVLVGDGTVAVQIQPGGETTLAAADGLLNGLTLHPLPVLRVPPGRSEPVGRGSVIQAALADLVAGRHVQLVGAPGVGRAAVARALVGHAAAGNRPGAVLLAGAEAHTLESLYTRLSGLFFDTLWYRPDEQALRTVTERLGPSGLIVITDCDLAGAESGRLVETFPECRFLLTSASAVTSASAGLGSAASVSVSIHEIPALTLADVSQLVAQALGRELTAPEREQAQAAHRFAGGRAAALVASAAFLRRAAESPRPTDLVALPPDRQAELLLAGFDEPSRRIVAALAAFGPASASLFPALAEKISADETDQRAFALVQAGLILESDEGYAVSEDTAAIAGPVSTQQTSEIAARLFQGKVPSPPPPFSLEVVRALVAAQQWESASRLARAASADAVASGRVEPWSDLVSLGAQAAREAGLTDDLRYFLRQQHTDALLREDIATAAALALALASLLHGAPTSPALLTRLSHARRLLHLGRHLLMAGHGAGTVATGIAVAAVAGTAVGLSQNPHPAATPKPAAVTSAPAEAVTPWQRPASATAPTWTVTMTNTPLTPLAAGVGKVSAQFPVVSAGITDPTRRTQVETALQKPIQQVYASIGQRADSAKSAGIVNPGYASSGQTFPTETTTVTQAGDLVSVVYDFGAGTGRPGSAATLAVLVRKDNATVIPQQAILTAAATTPAGAARLNAAVAAQLPPAARGNFPPVAIGCVQSSGAGFVGPAIAVTATGLTFYVSDDAEACAGRTAVPVPYGQLTGLVNPLIVDLVAVKEGA